MRPHSENQHKQHMIVVIDYGMGNLRSVSKALELLGAPVKVSDKPADVEQAHKLILPGVGSFPAAMQELSSRNLIEPVKKAIAAGKPYLGICLGLQLLFESSEEGAGSGLNVLPGRVRRFSTEKSGLKVPHMGWNQIHRRREDCPLLNGIPDESFFYFVHSYYPVPAVSSYTVLETDYGGPFASMVWNKQVFATQFHPEKSQTVGLQLLKNFVDL